MNVLRTIVKSLNSICSALPSSVKKGAIGIFLIVLLVRAFVPIIFALKYISYPIDYFPQEGDFLFFAHQVRRGLTIYNRSEHLPLMGDVYPPLYPWIMALFSYVAPLNLAGMRILGLIPFVAVGVLTGAFLWRRKTGAALIGAGVLMLYCCYSHVSFLLVPRCDSWMALFSFSALWFLWREQPTTRTMILGGMFSALALFSKQTALPCLAAIHLHALYSNRRMGLIAAGSAAGFCSILLGLFYLQYGPDLIYALTALSVRRKFEPSHMTGLLLPCFLALSVVLGLALIRCVVHAVWRTWDMLDSYVVGSLLITGMMLFDCSGSNYLIITFTGIVLAAALFLKELMDRVPERSLLIATALILGGVQLAVQWPYEDALTAPEGEKLAEAYVVQRFLTSTDEPVYTERLWGAVADRDYMRNYYVEPTHIRTLAPGAFSMDTLEEPFKEQRFSRVILQLYTMHFTYDSQNSYDFPQRVAKYYRTVRFGTLKLAFGCTLLTPIVYLERK